MDVSDLPTVLDLPAAATLFGTGRPKAYELVCDDAGQRRSSTPAKLIKVPARPLLDLLKGRVGPRLKLFEFG